MFKFTLCISFSALSVPQHCENRTFNILSPSCAFVNNIFQQFSTCFHYVIVAIICDSSTILPKFQDNVNTFFKLLVNWFKLLNNHLTAFLKGNFSMSIPTFSSLNCTHKRQLVYNTKYIGACQPILAIIIFNYFQSCFCE